MNPFEFVLILFGMMFVFGVIRHKMGIPARSMRQMRGDDDAKDPRLEMENARLKDEVQQLKDRVKVLERIAVDKENSLAREIDDLRDR